MVDELCHSENLGALGNFNVWSGIGLIFDLVFWVALLAGLTLLVVLVIRRARVSAAKVPTAGQLTALEILKAQYARGEITRDQYEVKKQDIS